MVEIAAAWGLCGCAGVAIGAALVIILVVSTSAGYGASDDRDELLNILVVDFEIKPIVARKIIEKGLSPWSRWRAKTRPFLWRLGRDWPEYSNSLKEEFQQVLEDGLPETKTPEPAGANGLEESGEILEPDSQDDSGEANGEITTQLPATSPSDGPTSEPQSSASD